MSQSQYQAYKAQRWAEQQAREAQEAEQAVHAPYLGPEPVSPVAPKAPVSPAPRGPKRLDPAALRRRRQTREAGFDFTLETTLDDDGNPSVVRARLPNLLDASSLATLPADMRREVFQMIEQVETLEGNGQGSGFGDLVDGMSSDQLADAFGAIASVVDAYCVIGFVEPRCYATEEEADEQGGAWVADIEFADRMAFFNYCSARQKGASATVTPFPDGRPLPPVGAGPADSAVSGAGQPEHGAPAQSPAATGGAG
jgi:hypothetical protein